MIGLLEPKEFPLTTSRGNTKTFILSKFPAIAGREIVAKYPVSNIPKVGEYAASEEVMLKCLSFVAVEVGEPVQQIRLTTRALVDNHAEDWETLARLEFAMLQYNCSFFQNGLNSGFFESISQKAAKWITPILTHLLGQLLDRAKPPQ